MSLRMKKPQGLSWEALRSLPQEISEDTQENGVTRASVEWCLERFLEGDRLSRLPCYHRFHPFVWNHGCRFVGIAPIAWRSYNWNGGVMECTFSPLFNHTRCCVFLFVCIWIPKKRKKKNCKPVIFCKPFSHISRCICHICFPVKVSVVRDL